ncbi:hypothetical protein ACU4GD_25635 [Cupriavidus basilensis]
MPDRSTLPAPTGTGSADASPASLGRATLGSHRDRAQVGRILAGEWTSGTAIAAESALAEHYGVALGTMRAAIQALRGRRPAGTRAWPRHLRARRADGRHHGAVLPPWRCRLGDSGVAHRVAASTLAAPADKRQRRSLGWQRARQCCA